MNDLFYHASNIGNLTELLPLSTVRMSGEKVCYFTSVRAYALFYFHDMEINHVTCGVSDAGIVIYHEQFPKQLETIYHGRSGYLYACENDDNMSIAHTNGIWAANKPVTVKTSEFVEDVYAEILKAEQSGEVQVIRYDSLSEEKKREIVDIMKNSIIRNNYLAVDTPKARFYAENFPQSWKDAETFITTRNHYDALIDENNDPVHDPEPLKAHMNKWDGEPFIEALQLTPDKSVLEIGVGTGRLAERVCGVCKSFTGIDISSKTVERAKENLKNFPNVQLICGDFFTHSFTETFDLIYSSLTFMHIKDKRAAIQKVAGLLNPNERFVLSISKDQQTSLECGDRQIEIYPDTAEAIASFLIEAGFIIETQFDTEFAVVFAAHKE